MCFAITPSAQLVQYRAIKVVLFVPIVFVVICVGGFRLGYLLLQRFAFVFDEFGVLRLAKDLQRLEQALIRNVETRLLDREVESVDHARDHFFYLGRVFTKISIHAVCVLALVLFEGRESL